MMDDGSGRDPYMGPPAARPGWVLPAEVVVAGPAPGYAYVGFWRRFCAFWIDALILAIPTWLTLIPFFFGPLSSQMFQFFYGPGRFITDPSTGRQVPNPAYTEALFASLEGMFRWFALAAVLVFAIQLLYHAILWSRRGGTFGQLILGIQVRSEVDGSRISFGRACLRYFGYIVSVWILYLGFIWVAFDPRKQGWHDKIAGTVAIRKVG
jgi:uncharacterized RDD family membrane protein YckC